MKNLNRFIIVFSALVLTAGLASCDRKKKLAEKIEGAWATDTPEYIFVSNAFSATLTTSMQFTVEPRVVDLIGGSFIISSNFDASYAVPVSDIATQPYSIKPSGIASIEGQWIVKDDDEIRVTLDPLTFLVKIDPETVAFNDDVLTGENVTAIDSIKPALIAQAEAGITGIFQSRFFGARELDDIWIKGSKMKCEINDIDYHFIRQSDPVPVK